MKFIVLKPTSPSKRHYLNVYNKLNSKPILKTKLVRNINKAGRNYSGKITIYHKGNGVKKLYRIIDFKKQEHLIGVVFSLEYDPYRNSNIASVYNINNKSFSYIIAPKNLKLGDIIGNNLSIKIGNNLTLNKVPIGCPIYNISLLPNSISKISRSAGTYSLVIDKTKVYCKLILSSGYNIFLSNKLFCNIGIVSNQFIFLKQLGKAGRSCWLNIRPAVRGVAMNSVDHPNGGGEGRKSSKNKSPWGKINK
jgi:large subunit ribosomal protein L2